MDLGASRAVPLMQATSANPRRRTIAGGFTLIEMMGAVSLLALLVGIFYSCWTAMLHSTRSGVDAAAHIQRERVALEHVARALGGALMVQSGEDWHRFDARTEAGFSQLSFVTSRPEDRASAHGMRFERVTLAVERVPGGKGHQLVRRVSSAVTHLANPVVQQTVLAQGVRQFQVLYPAESGGWTPHWPRADLLPERARILIALEGKAAPSPRTREVLLAATGFTHAVVEEAHTTLRAEQFVERGFPVNKGRFVFIIDKSGSMASKDVLPDRLTAAKQAVMASLQQLAPEDEFFIYFYDREFEGMPALSALPATPENVLAMRNWVASHEARGGTDPAGVLRAAFEHQPTDIWLMSDGVFSRAVLALADELNPSRAVKINTAAFGSAAFSSHRVLKQLSAQHGGVFLLVTAQLPVP